MESASLQISLLCKALNGTLAHVPLQVFFSISHVLAQEAAQAAVVELEAKLQQAEEAAEASSARAAAAEEAADEAAVKAETDVAAMRQALSTANMAKAEMDAKLAKAAVAMTAAEELKEAR